MGRQKLNSSKDFSRRSLRSMAKTFMGDSQTMESGEQSRIT
jgi:hypothetical protein